MTSQGRRPGSRIVDVAVVDAEPEVADHLGLVARGRRWCGSNACAYADDEPMAVETVYLDHASFPDIGAELAADASLYALLESRYGVVPASADETIETVLAPPGRGAPARHRRGDADAAADTQHPRRVRPAGRVRPLAVPRRPLPLQRPPDPPLTPSPDFHRDPVHHCTHACVGLCTGRSSGTGWSVAVVVVDDQQVGLVGGERRGLRRRRRRHRCRPSSAAVAWRTWRIGPSTGPTAVKSSAAS